MNRPLFYTPNDIGLRKVDVTAERLIQFNPQLKVRTTHRYLQPLDDFYEVSRGSTFVVRAVDSPPECIAWVNEACVRLGIPYSGGGFFPQGTIVGPTVIPWESSCIACNAPAVAPRVDRGTGGILSPLVLSIAGALAHEEIPDLGGTRTTHSAKPGVVGNTPVPAFHFHHRS